MIPPFDRLYEHAFESREIVFWLGSQKEIERYRKTLAEIEAVEEDLLRSLSGEERERFARYVELQDIREDLNGKILFAQGAAMGIPLGLFSALAP